MAYICDKNIKCQNCSHYRYDEDYGELTCWAAYDEKNNNKDNLIYQFKSYISYINQQKEKNNS